MNEIKIGLECYWMGGNAFSVYGKRYTPCKVISITSTGRIEIEIQTQNGKINKYVSNTTLEPKK